MTKENEKQNQKRVEKKILIAIPIIILLIFLPALLIIHFIENSTNKKIQEQEDYTDWLVDNCKCLANEKMACPEGFVLNETARLCRTEGKYTHVLLKCSKYDCGGEIVNWNFDEEEWEPELNEILKVN